MAGDKLEWMTNSAYSHVDEAQALRSLIKDHDKLLLHGAYTASLSRFLARGKNLVDAVSTHETPGHVDKTYQGLENIPKDTSYDAIILAWPTPNNQDRNTLQGLKNHLEDEGALLVETPRETSEYTQILSNLMPHVPSRMVQRRQQLQETLLALFTVQRYRVETRYMFKKRRAFIEYFDEHIYHERGERLDSEEKDTLRKLEQRYDIENIQEQTYIYLCR